MISTSGKLLLTWALAIGLVACPTLPDPAADDDDDAAGDDDDDTILPVAGCLDVTLEAGAPDPNETGLFDELEGATLLVSVCGLAEEIRNGIQTAWTWEPPASVSVQGAPEPLASELAAAWLQGWTRLTVFAPDDAPLGVPVFQAAQIFGDGGRGITVNLSTWEPLDLAVAEDGGPVIAPFTSEAWPILANVEDPDDPAHVADAVQDPSGAITLRP